MSSTTVRADVHGLYVRAGGYLFRPNAADGPRPGWSLGGPVFAADGETTLAVGDAVVARHVGGSVVAVLRKGEVRERWHAHGAYEEFVDGRTRRIPTGRIWVAPLPPVVPAGREALLRHVGIAATEVAEADATIPDGVRS